MNKLLFNLILVFLIFVFFPQLVFADVVNPNYFTAKCKPGEIEVECSWGRTTLNSPINNRCVRYEKNPNYRFLEGTGSTFGGRQKFCFKTVSTGNFISYHVKAVLPLILITLLLEIPIFFVLVVRDRRALFTVLSANVISVSLFYLATILLQLLLLTKFTQLIIMELAVIAFEAVFIKLMLKEIRFKKILIYSFVANFISAVLGNILLNLVHSF